MVARRHGQHRPEVWEPATRPAGGSPMDSADRRDTDRRGQAQQHGRLSSGDRTIPIR